jgi:hypothetical protein
MMDRHSAHHCDGCPGNPIVEGVCHCSPWMPEDPSLQCPKVPRKGPYEPSAPLYHKEQGGIQLNETKPILHSNTPKEVSKKVLTQRSPTFTTGINNFSIFQF